MAQKQNIQKQSHFGILTGLGCYIFWGICPVYWKLLGNVDPFEIIAQRIIWCFVFTAIICALFKADFVFLFKQKRARRYLTTASIVITLNWSVYIIAVNTGHIIDTSIGYYLNPLVSIMLGLVIFKERLTPLQWIAVIFCAAGIIYFTFSYGSFPWISIVLAVSFGTYGAIKKKGGYPAIETIAVESAVMTPVAIIFAIALALTTGTHGFMGDISSPSAWKTTALLIGGGVITAIPLILFAKAANSIPLTILGFIQYVSPTIALLIGVFAFGEPFTEAHMVCFACIWIGLALVLADSLITSKRVSRNKSE